jgi:hypothetical protein
LTGQCTGKADVRLRGEFLSIFQNAQKNQAKNPGQIASPLTNVPEYQKADQEQSREKHRPEKNQ